MADNTTIEWAESTWNPIAGCSVLSPGCTNCYAMKMAARIERMMAALGKPTPYAGLTQPSKAGPVWNGRIAVASDETLTQPLRWKRPRRIFVNSMSDLFHEGVADETIDKVFAVMALCPQHTFQVLTKRAARMHRYFDFDDLDRRINGHIWSLLGTPHGRKIEHGGNWRAQLPLPNVWLGVSAEDQPRADERIGYLLDTPAAIRFVSLEPLLGAIDVHPHLFIYTHADNARLADESDDVIANPLDFNDPATTPAEDICTPRLDWVIAGGESGKGARPMHPDWVRSLRDQCAAAKVPFFFKQWGEHEPDEIGPEDPRSINHPPGHVIYRKVGKKAAGAKLDGKMHREFPTTKQGDGNGDV